MNAPPYRLPILPTAQPALERALAERLEARAESVGRLGDLESLAVRLALMQNTLQPRLHDPQVVLVAADHGLAVEGVPPHLRLQTHRLAECMLEGQLPLALSARRQGIPLTVVDAGMAEDLRPQDSLMIRKIAHGTRNSRLSAAMTVGQAQAALRVGMEIAHSLPGNVLLCAGVGVGAQESAALVLSRLTDTPVSELFVTGARVSSARRARLLAAGQSALTRHRDAVDPIEVLAAVGGFEMAVLAGIFWAASSRRRALVIDGTPALAALMVASRLAPAVTDYCFFTRSHAHPGLDQALDLFRAGVLQDLGLDTTDGTGAVLAWPLLQQATMVLCDQDAVSDDLPQLTDDLFDRSAPDRSPTPEPVQAQLWGEPAAGMLGGA